jgi:hypothetical protein
MTLILSKQHYTWNTAYAIAQAEALSRKKSYSTCVESATHYVFTWR